jgi:hypothetical protein
MQVTLHVKTDVPYAPGRQFSITAASPNDVESAQVDALVKQEWDEGGEIGTLVVWCRTAIGRPGLAFGS